MPGGSRSLPSQPSLRYLRLEAKRRLAAGEFTTLHDAQTAVAREHGLPSWAALKQFLSTPAAPGTADEDGHALAQLRWVISRFGGVGDPGWAAPGEDEIREHFTDQVLAVIPPATLNAQIAAMAGDLRGELTVLGQGPVEAQVRLADVEYLVVVEPEPPHRVSGLRALPLGRRVRDPRVTAPAPTRTLGEVPAGIGAAAEESFAESGLAALLLAGGTPENKDPWVLTKGWADLDRGQVLDPGHRFPAPGVTALVTATAVLRLVAEGRVGLDAPANDHLRTVRLADDTVTVRDLLAHTGGVDNPAELYADAVQDLATLMGPVIGCSGPRGVVRPSNGGVAVLGQLIVDLTGTPYADAARALVLDPLGLRDSTFPASTAGIDPAAVTCYALTREGMFQPLPAQVCTVQAAAGLWSTGADLVRLGLGWPTLLPAPLAREALTPQVSGDLEGPVTGLGWLLSPRGDLAFHAGAGPDATATLGLRIRDHRTHVVLTSRMIPINAIEARLLRAWTNASLRGKGEPMYQPYPTGAQLPARQRPPVPPSVATAIKVMYAGALTSLIGIAFDLVTVGATKSAIEKRSPKLTLSQVSSVQHVLVTSFIIGGVIGAAVWIVLARLCQAGKHVARITGTALFGLATLDTLVGAAVAPLAGLVRIWAIVVWLVGLTAVIFLWQRSSSAFFKGTGPS